VESIILKFFDAVTTQCGITGVGLATGLITLGYQLARARASHETDREKWMVAAERRATAFEALATAQGDTRGMLSEIRGLLTALLGRNSGLGLNA
jgi:hypothetical protein